MKKTIFCIVAIILGVTTQGLFAQGPIGQSEAEVYKLTFTKFSLQDDAGTWHVVNDTPATVDIASTNVSGLAASIAGAAATVPVGHYKAFKSEVSGTMTIKGYCLVAGTVYYTTAAKVPVSAPTGQSPDGFGIVAGRFTGTVSAFLTAVGNGTITDYAEGTIRPPTVTDTFVGAQDTEDLTVGVGADSPVTETMEVKLANTIQVWDFSGGAGGGPDGLGDVIFPGVPQITVP